MIILIDNFDSFTYNIVQAYQKLGEKVHVIRNNKATVNQIKAMCPRLLIIGPGPGNPKKSGISKECVFTDIPIFGLCLGHQVIGEVFGADIIKAPKVMHGKTSRIFHENKGIFSNLSQGFVATRYHSLIIHPQTLPPSLEITAWTKENEIMGIRHRNLPIEGVQFHPESVASEEGMNLFRNTLLYI